MDTLLLDDLCAIAFDQTSAHVQAMIVQNIMLKVPIFKLFWVTVCRAKNFSKLGLSNARKEW